MSSEQSTLQFIENEALSPINDYLVVQEKQSLLRFITCGSVDDGKSSLIGRLLFETSSVNDSELQRLHIDSKKFGHAGSDIDYALLVDGLSAEREQGITIDVAYRYFQTNRRKFIVADTPGHEQYTRNMATGASTADLAIVMVDASKGLLTQTKRHSKIVSELGVRHVIVAINKMDLVDYQQAVFCDIELAYRDFAATLNFEKITIIPVSAIKGDNICYHSHATKWYQGPSLLKTLEQTEVTSQLLSQPFHFCVQWINRPDSQFRGYAGTVSSGTIKPGDSVCIQPGNQLTTIEKIVSFDGELPIAVSGQAVTLTLVDDIDISRGDVISQTDTPLDTANQFESSILWLDEEVMISNREYLIKIGTQTALCTLQPPKYRLNVNTLAKQPTKELRLNELGVCDIHLNKTIPFTSYSDNKTLGGFILIDKISHHTVACGFINFALRRGSNIHHHRTSIDCKARSDIKGHGAAVIWLTGLSGAGKSTIANALDVKLHQRNIHTQLLDGDNVRLGLNRDLGFTQRCRVENIRRIAEVAKLLTDAGLITIVSFISPFSQERKMAKDLIGGKQFIEVHIDTSLKTAETRDVKGLYKKARRGEIENFTGIDSPYQKPLNPDIHIDTESHSAEQAADKIINALLMRDIIQ